MSACFVLSLLFRESPTSRVAYSKLSQQEEVIVLSDADKEEEEEELRTH